jgi:carbamoyl-phosphate synthase small subunit
MSEAYIALERGTVLTGQTRAPGEANGELVFTTPYTGYEESLTDPSYEAQVLTFAYPLVGNYGVRAERFESDRVHPSAAVAREFTPAVAEWLQAAGVPAIDGIDTRDVVLSVRDHGTMRCGIAAGPEASPERARAQLADCPTMSDRVDIGDRVSVDAPVVHRSEGEGPTVALLDCGTKGSIIDNLLERGADVHVLPHDAPVSTVEAVDPDLVFVSNGPGDPANYGATRALVEQVLGEVPIAGICLGMQIVADAVGGETTKMAFGHRGVNQPVQSLDSGRVVMTTQNHGYKVADAGTLAVTHRNVNDDTPEGAESTALDVMTRQYHPEAHPGPHDTTSFFDDVCSMAVAGAHPATS